MSRNQRLNATLTIGAALQASVRRNLDVVGRGLRRVGDEIDTVKRRQADLGRQRDVLIKQGQSVDALDREYQQLNETLRRLEDRQRRLRNLSGAMGQVGGAFSNMTRETTRLAARTTAAVGVAGAAIFGLANSTATLGDDVAKTAGSLGIGIEALQEYRYAAERSGVASAEMDSALATLNKGMGQAIMGTGRARRAFDRLGLSAAELAEISPDEALEVIADRLMTVEDHAERAALQTLLFGDAGAKLTNLLAGGSRGMLDLRDRARQLGFVLSEEAARDAEAFQDALLDARLASQGLKNTIGSALMPVVTDAMGELTNWLMNNREPVTDFAGRLATGLREALPVIGEVVSGLATVSENVYSGTAAVAEFIGGWDRLGVVVGSLFAGKAIASVLSFGVALGKVGGAALKLVAPGALPMVGKVIRGISRALLFNPIGLAIAAIAGGAYLIIENWDKIRPALQPIIDWFNGALEFARDNVVTPFFEGIDRGVELGAAAWQRFRDGLSRIIDWLSRQLDSLMSKLEPILNAGAKLREIGSGVSDRVGGAIGWAKEAVAGLLSSDEEESDAPQAGPGRPQARAVGGSFLPGALLVGEKGPEMRFEDRAGFIATNRQLREMAANAASIRSVGEKGLMQARTIGRSFLQSTAQPGQSDHAAPKGRSDADASILRVGEIGLPQVRAIGRSFLQGSEQSNQSDSPAAKGQSDASVPIRGVAMRGLDRAAEGARQVVANLGGITINAAPGMDPQAIAQAVRREFERMQRSALYDLPALGPGG